MAKVIKKKRGRPALKKPVKVVKKKVVAKKAKAAPKKISKAAPKRGRPAGSTKNAKILNDKLVNVIIDLSYSDCLNFFSVIMKSLKDIHDYVKKNKDCFKVDCDQEEGSEEEDFEFETDKEGDEENI